jgi:hypothetical protein
LTAGVNVAECAAQAQMDKEYAKLPFPSHEIIAHTMYCMCEKYRNENATEDGYLFLRAAPQDEKYLWDEIDRLRYMTRDTTNDSRQEYYAKSQGQVMRMIGLFHVLFSGM